jgi:hypothetical protein
MVAEHVHFEFSIFAAAAVPLQGGEEPLLLQIKT